LTQELWRQPTAEEISLDLGLSVERVQEVLSAIPVTVSLDTPVGTDDDRLWEDVITDQNVPQADEFLDIYLLREQIEVALQCLDPMEAAVVRLRFGLDGDGRRTLKEVGEQVHLTRERVRQLEARALKKMRNLIGIGPVPVPTPPAHPATDRQRTSPPVGRKVAYA
jgi:RNA polymerase primary sigma factor